MRQVATLSLEIPDRLLAMVEQTARKRGITVNDLIVEALRSYLDQISDDDACTLIAVGKDLCDDPRDAAHR